MRSRSLIVLAVVVAVVAAYIFVFERHQATTDDSRERAEKVFPDLDQESVVAVEITTAEQSFKLSKTDGHWRLDEPISYPADDGAVGSMLRSLAELKAERRLGEDEVDRAAYGLDAPTLFVELRSTDGVRHQLAVGGETPRGSNRAVATDQPGVILCAARITSALDKDIDQWRSHDVVEIYPDDVASINLIAGEDRVQAVRLDDTWKLLHPLEDLADREHLRNLISDLNTLEVKAFLDQDDPADYGLSEPEYHLTVLRTEGQEPLTLAFGASREVAGTTHVACLRNGHDLFWVGETVRIRLAKAPVRWRSATVFPFDTWDVERFSITSGDSTLVTDRSDGLWRLSDGSEADYTEVQKRLTALSELEAASHDLVLPSAEADGTIELSFKGEAEATTVTFFPPMAAGGRTLVTVSNRNTVMSVEPADAAAIIDNPQSLAKTPDEETAPVIPEND